MQEQSTTDNNNNLVALWEQMGASTGSLLGKIIGLTAQYGLQAYQQTVLQPLKQTTHNFQAPSVTGVPPDIREQTWGEMGREYGEYLGTSIGMAMDLLIKSVENTVETGTPDPQESK